MVDVRRGETWHIAVNGLGVYIRAHLMADPINISVQDARDIAHAILELTDDV